MSLAIILLFDAPTCAADSPTVGFEWSRKEIVLRPAAHLPTTTTEFQFRNAAPVPLKIASIATSCACTTAKADKETYLPGESGVLRVNLGVKGYEGRVTKFVRIFTDPAAWEPTTLRVVLELPENVVLRPKAVAWAHASSPTERVVDVFVPSPEKVTLDNVQAENAVFSAQLETTPTPGVYQIKILPAATTTAFQARILLHATVQGERRQYAVQASIK